MARSLGHRATVRKFVGLLLVPMLLNIILMLSPIMYDLATQMNLQKDAEEWSILPQSQPINITAPVVVLGGNENVKTTAATKKEVKNIKPINMRCLKEVPIPLPSVDKPPPKNSSSGIYKVNLWDDGTHCKYREMLFNKEGFYLHNSVTLVDSPDDADLIVWVSTRARSESEIPPSNYSNVVLLDYSDGCSTHQAMNKVKHLIGHFKRSFVKRVDGVYERNCTDDKSVLPFAYSGAEALINRNVNRERKFILTNLLREHTASNGGSRKRVIEWTRAFVGKHNYTKNQAHVGATVGHGRSGTDWNEPFMAHMANSKIVVTANPRDWEGDFRLWEALLSGALVFVDNMAILNWMPYPYEHKKHLVYYDSTNQTAFEELLQYYITHEDEANAIGVAGYKHTLDYHMTTNRVDYILGVVESKMLKLPMKSGAKDGFGRATTARLRPIIWTPPMSNFTPEEFKAGHLDKYVNLPIIPQSTTYEIIQTSVTKAINRPVDKPYGLIHEAHPPGHNVVMGLASYPNAMGIFERMVGSLRTTGYDGHIILGVHSNITVNEQEYLKKMGVTFYTVEYVTCDKSIQVKGNDKGMVVRSLCAKGLEKLKLEWGRFEMCRQWLHACDKCTGWALVMDTRDVFFQANPFGRLPSVETSPYDLLFIEEISKHTCPKKKQEEECDPKRYYTLENNRHYRSRAGMCYGDYYELDMLQRPILCSGTIVGTREGIDRFLAVFVDEFYRNNQKDPNKRCRSPHTTDQFILQYMYYTGKFGVFDRTATAPWGTGPINTIGHACVNNNLLPNDAHSATDLTEFDNATGFIMNIHEGVISPVLHQFDRCHNWIQPFFGNHPELFAAKGASWLRSLQS